MAPPVDLHNPATLADPYEIVPFDGPVDAVVTPPGSKSLTNRALVCAALAHGTSVLDSALVADDTEAMLGVLAACEVPTSVERDADHIEVTGCDGPLAGASAVVDVRQSGTTARFALPLLALSSRAQRVTAHPQMQARPMGETFAALEALGARVEPEGATGSLPVRVRGPLRSGTVSVSGDVSSQFLSGLLLVGPCLPDGLRVEVTTELVSRPYVDLTIAVMAAFGASVDEPSPSTFVVAPGGYQATRYRIEPDASAASYVFGAAAVCGGRVTVPGLGAASPQGDVGFASVLEQMGAHVTRSHDALAVQVGTPLRGIDVDLATMSDTAQTLAAVATRAEGPTRVRGIGFIRNKETDRIAAVVAELRRLGIDAREEPDGFVVEPGEAAPAVVQTYNDHRMAMSFALLGLTAPGVSIADPRCVAKTFPTYFAVLESLRPSRSPQASSPVQ